MRTVDHSQRRQSGGGFTLIELLVTMAIFVLITAVMLVNHGAFGGRVLLENLAYEVALTIRQAQQYGIAVQRFDTTFSAGYGIHFDVSASDPANRTTYILFADIFPSPDGNGIFDPSEGENVPPSPYSIGRGYYIKTLCVPAGVDGATCTSVEKLDVLFRRPDPDACISANSAITVDIDGDCISTNPNARLVLSSPRGDDVSVVIEASGQIAVQR